VTEYTPHSGCIVGKPELIPGRNWRKHQAEGFATLPKILSVDVARFGDDQTVIGTRQGRKARILAKLRGLDTVQVAERVIRFIEEEQPDATVIDGDGIGAGVIDQIKYRGFENTLFEFHGNETANDPNMYFNRRCEVWAYRITEIELKNYRNSHLGR
jgi:hypothetical protein